MPQWLEALRATLEPYPWAYTAIAATALVLAAWLANWVTKRVLLRGLQRVLARGRMLMEARRREAEAEEPVGVGADLHSHEDSSWRLAVIPRLANVVPALVLYAGVGALPDLPESLVTVVRAGCQAFIVLTVALAVARALDLINMVYERRPDARNKPIKGYLQVVKIVMFALVALSVVATMIGAKFLHLLTGLGAATAVLMLIFQDTILSLVASVQISNDGRIRIGDWIEMPSQNADGDVIDIALHTVTVQNWDKTVTTIPTKKLISDSFKNWRGMSESGGRRIKRALYLDQASVQFLDEDARADLTRFVVLREYLGDKQRELETWNTALGEDGREAVNMRRVTNLGTFRAYVDQYLRRHPGIHPDMTLLVRQLQPGATGIPLEIYCFTNTVAWGPYEAIQSDVFDHLLAILPEFGLRVFQQPAGGDVRAALETVSAAPRLPGAASLPTQAPQRHDPA